MNLVDSWIDERLMPYMTRHTINKSISSYTLKHLAENELGFYVSNDTIKDLLKQKGVKCEVIGSNAYYPLSSKAWKKY